LAECPYGMLTPEIGMWTELRAALQMPGAGIDLMSLPARTVAAIHAIEGEINSITSEKFREMKKEAQSHGS
jgi:hypothetical protein